MAVIDVASLSAHKNLVGRKTFCSRDFGWQSLLLRGYSDPPKTPEFSTLPTRDQLVVLVTGGSCAIESWKGGHWRGATYRPGHIGMVAPGEAARLRWHGQESHSTLQLHLPADTMGGVAKDVLRRTARAAPSCLSTIDPTIATLMVDLERAAREGALSLYAESAAHYLAAHLLLRYSRDGARSPRLPEADAARRLEAYMRENFAQPITLECLAGLLGCSRFDVLRLAKRHWGTTPMRRLTGMRMEHACILLRARRLTVLQIALECGYGGPSPFAAAFRRWHGLSPAEYRRIT